MNTFNTQVFILLSAGLLFCKSTFGQKTTDILKLSPFHFFQSTMKLDWEHSSNGKSSFIFSPRMTALDQDDEKILGGGLELGRRTYLPTKDTLKLHGFYVQVSLSYNYYSTSYRDYYKVSSGYYYGTDTTHYITHKEQINQGGTDFVLGYQVSFKDVFYLDLFFGGGMRIGISSRGDDSNYRSSILEPGYSGVIPKAGIKLGLKL